MCEIGEVGSFSVVELQGPGDGIEHLLGSARQVTAFDLGVVLNADPGERGDLAAAQARYAAVAAFG